MCNSFPNATEIMLDLDQQKFCPKMVVYSNSRFGEITAVIHEITSNPIVRFVASRKFDNSSQDFGSLEKALDYIGIIG